MTTAFTDRIVDVICSAAALPEVHDEVVRNHDDNGWWPRGVEDWRLRMLLATWTSRVSYRSIDHYREVVGAVTELGWDAVMSCDDDAIATVTRPIGLPDARVRTLRGLASVIASAKAADQDLVMLPSQDLIDLLWENVSGVGPKLAQCAALYAKGYHCGIIPVDSGMVDMLRPCIGVALPSGPKAHEVFRHHLETAVTEYADALVSVVGQLGYNNACSLPAGPPTWWAHLVLVYFKRLHCNRRRPDECPLRDALGGSPIRRMCARPSSARSSLALLERP